MKSVFFILFVFKTLLSASFSGIIVDKTTSLPIANAIVSNSSISTSSDANGSYIINSDEKALFIKAYGYKPYKLNLDDNVTAIKLEPITVKALYLTFWGANINSKTIKNILDIIDKTEINSIVVDVKNEYGSTSYKTASDKANGYGAANNRTIKDIQSFISLMKSKNIYTIARIVTFKDELQASNNFEYAIKNKKNELSRDADKMAWIDPFDKRSHEYTVAIAEDAANAGFDEINFDYIRFPAKTELKLSKESTEENRVKAIEDFLLLAKNRLRKYGTFISVSIYGDTCWREDDTGIGQKIESLSKHADYIAPMLYPSGFAQGSFGVKYPADYPYITIYKSIKNIEGKIDSKRVRPWLQSFKDYAHSRREYKKFEIREQIKATDDIKTSGWMMWSPSSKYNIDCFVKKEKNALILGSTL
ncbi:MAG: putative glycoside hydrolase [Sulfurimonas sp.]|uniref:putative glycoside hydrolase n=1 Tax=Sulfurimonas sp. TaxID=2022749 RepID=UPI0026262EF7|nr:putative glycoside hydrolase [Sulfurimonas sp.]MDD5372226.1 putative glycoside hydrolase [Sulfurimonas sp.]